MSTNIQDAERPYISGTYYFPDQVAIVRCIPYCNAWTPDYTINGEHPSNYHMQRWASGIPAHFEGE